MTDRRYAMTRGAPGVVLALALLVSACTTATPSGPVSAEPDVVPAVIPAATGDATATPGVTSDTLTGTTAPQATPSDDLSTTPLDRDDLVTDLVARPVAPLPRPARGDTIVDPAFGTSITRITDAGAGGVVKPMYSTMPAWNADESYLVLYATGTRQPGHLLLDGETYQEVRRLDVGPSDIEQIWWHPTDPDTFLYPSGNELRQYSVAADASTTVRAFPDCEGVSAGGDVNWTSWDGDVVGLLCATPDAPVMLTYRISTDAVGTPFPLESELWVAPVPLPSGDAFWFGTDERPRVVDADGATLVELTTIDSFEHSTVGQGPDGRDTHYSVVFDPVGGTDVGALVATDLATDTSQVIVGPETGYPYPPSGIHLSAVAHRARGLVAVSVVGVTDPADQETLDQELLLVDTGRDEVYRVGHHRSWGKGGDFGYFAEPHVTISPSGTRLLFGSDWGNGDRVDTYVVDLR